MADRITNRQLLDILVQESKGLKEQIGSLNGKFDDLAKKNYELAAEFSNYMNKQDKENDYVRGILERNDRTGQVGVVSQLNINTKEIADLKQQNKINAGKISIAVVILAGIGGLVFKILSLWD
jgi:hypothetical protein